MAIVIITAGATGRDYPTLLDALTSLPGDAIEADNSYVIELYNDAVFSESVYWSGMTTDADHTLTVRAAAGHSWRDSAGAGSGPLTMSQANGVLIDGGSEAQTIDLYTEYLVVDGLQIKNVENSYGIAAHFVANPSVTVTNCLIGGGASQGLLAENPDVTGDVTIRNCVVIGGYHGIRAAAATAAVIENCVVIGATATGIISSGAGTTAIRNSTVVMPSNVSVGTDGITVYGALAGSKLVVNCAVFGYSVPFKNIFTSGTSSSYINTASGHNATNGASAAPFAGTGSLTSLTYASQFVQASNAGGVADFRLKAGSSLINAGVTLTMASDLFGVTRPQGAAWDIGAREYVSGSPPWSLQWSEGNDLVVVTGALRASGVLAWQEQNDVFAAGALTTTTGTLAWQEENDITALVATIAVATLTLQGAVSWQEQDTTAQDVQLRLNGSAQWQEENDTTAQDVQLLLQGDASWQEQDTTSVDALLRFNGSAQWQEEQDTTAVTVLLQAPVAIDWQEENETTVISAALRVSYDANWQEQNDEMGATLTLQGAALTGAALAIATISGALSSNIALVGSANATAATSGALAATITLGGAASAQVVSSGSVTTGIALFGFAGGVVTASGPISTSVALSAGANAVVVASAALTTGVRLTATANAIAIVDAALTTDMRLTATANAIAIVDATLITGITLIAMASAIATTDAALTTGITLIATANGAVAADAALTTDMRLTVATNVSVQASGLLTTAIVLQGQFDASWSSVADLDTAITLDAQAICVSACSAMLNASALTVNPHYLIVGAPRTTRVDARRRKR